MTKESIWEWYVILNKYKESPLSMAQFAAQENINPNVLWGMKYRLEHNKFTNPEEYKRMLNLGYKYIESNLSVNEFVANNDINKSSLSLIRTHISYLKILNEVLHEKGIKQEPEETHEPMGFIQIPTSKNILQEKLIESCPDPEIVEKQNDIELIIYKGVKVTVAPNIAPEKMIKIIELLKDL